MKAISKAVSLLAVVGAWSLIGSHIFAKGGGGSGGGASHPSQVKTSGTSAAPRAAAGTLDLLIFVQKSPNPAAATMCPVTPSRPAVEDTWVRTASWFSATDPATRARHENWRRQAGNRAR